MEKLRLFTNLGEQLKAIHAAATTRVADTRLERLNKEFQDSAKGMNEGVGEDGGFVVQSDFAGAMVESAAKAGEILPLVDQYKVGSTSNAASWVEPDESDVSETVFGGVQVYWQAEADELQQSEVKLRKHELKLFKLSGLAYATLELDSDSTFISDFYTKAFTLGIQRKLEEMIITGNGIGRPLGILNANGLLTIAKEGAQAAASLVWANIAKMYNQALNKDSTGRYVWLAHPDVTEQFDEMAIPTSLANAIAYHPANEQSSGLYVKGRPWIESEFCSALGTAGDVLFTDLSQYMLVLKDKVQADTSIHVRFLNAENAFRFTFRANGMPRRPKTITIKNSTKPRSSYVTLADRA